MPIEIRELHINVMVQDEQQKTNTSAANVPQVQINNIVAECVEQVLNILKEKQER